MIMAFNTSDLWVFRIVPVQNLAHDLQNGLYCKNDMIYNTQYVSIGSKDVISQRDGKFVKCFAEDVVNDYVPFYFSVRTPMLYNIKTGHGVPAFPQKDIVYLCCKFEELACDDFKWCYTNGNAATKITKFYSNFTDIENDIDWHSILTTDFRDENADGDEDRIRKKHAEFLVKSYVPSDHIRSIVVYDKSAMVAVTNILDEVGMDIKIYIDPNSKFYF